MTNFLRKHPEAVLTALALVFSGIVFVYFIWETGAIMDELNRAMNPSIGAQSVTMFNLQGAQSLNLHGLVQPTP